MKKNSRRWLVIFVIVIALIVAGRLYLHTWALNHVNHALGDLKGYKGSVSDIDIHLYRGAYTIHNLKIDKDSGKIPVPFINIQTIDLAIQWGSLIHGKVVSDIKLEKPVLNFAVSGSDKQTGKGEDWTKAIKDLMPIDINHITFTNGSLTYQDFASNPKVDVYVHNMSGEVDNLRNVVDKAQPLPSKLQVKGDSIGGGKLEMSGRMDILKLVPDMDLKTKLEKVDLRALNSFTQAYANIDVKKGNLDIYSDLIVKDKKVSGYVKPIATGISLIDLKTERNPIQLAWETAVSSVLTIFTNQSKDQFATKVPLTGNLGNINTDIWSTLGGIVRNAFVKAFDKGLDKDSDADEK